jgi:hypothetical protein
MRLLRSLAVLLCLAPAFAAAQTRPDFSGNWVLDAARSQLPTTSRATVEYTYPRTVTQSEREIRMVVTAPTGEPRAVPITFRFTTTPDVMTSTREGRTMRTESTVQWSNNDVVQTMATSMDGQSMTSSTSVLRLEDDGRVMSLTRDMTLPDGSIRVIARWVYVRGT